MSRLNIYRAVLDDSGEVMCEGTATELGEKYGIGKTYIRSSASLHQPIRARDGIRYQFEKTGYYDGHQIVHVLDAVKPTLPKLEEPKKRKVMSLREVDKASKKSGMSYGYFVARRGV
jgi:hypothetical protein